MQPDKQPFHIPVAVGLLGPKGDLLASRTLELTEVEQTFEPLPEPEPEPEPEP